MKEQNKKNKYAFENKQGIRACVVSNFRPGKNVNYIENLTLGQLMG